MIYPTIGYSRFETRERGVNRSSKRKTSQSLDLRGIDLVSPDFQLNNRQSGDKARYGENFRLYGENDRHTSNPIVSRKGSKQLNNFIKTTFNNVSPADINGYTEVAYSKIAGTVMDIDGIGLTFGARNPNGCTGYLKVDLYPYEEHCDEDGINLGISESTSVIPLEDIDSNVTRIYSTTYNTCKKGKYIVAFSVYQNFQNDDCNNAVELEDCNVEIAIGGDGSHYSADVELTPDLCEEVEKPIWTAEAQEILLGQITTEGGAGLGVIEYCWDEKKYAIWAVRCGDKVNLYRTSISTGSTRLLTDLIDPRTEEVNFALVEKYVVWVDGYTDLRRYSCDDGLESINYPPGQEPEIASLILHHGGRIFLNNVDSPNQIQFSAITQNGISYNTFESTNFFHAPDESQKATACDPITALADFNGSVWVFTTAEYFEFQNASGFDIPDQVVLEEREGEIGVLNQKAVAVGRNMMVMFSPHGVYYTRGEGAIRISDSVESELKRIPEEMLDKVHVQYWDDEVRVYYSRDGDFNDHMLLYYFKFQSEERSGEWVLDSESYVSCTFVLKGTNRLFELNSCKPMIAEAEVSNLNYDSPIRFRYRSPYKWFDSPFQEHEVSSVHVLFAAYKPYAVEIGTSWDDRPPKYKLYYIEPSLDTPESDNFDTREGDLFAGGLSRKVVHRPQDNGRQIQIRIKADLISQLELQGWLFEWDSQRLS